MKMNKWFMLGMVGLAFAACSNEEDPGNNGPIKGAVAIKIQAPELTRVVNATSGQTVTVVPQENTEVVITLTASKGGGTIRLTPDEWANGKVVTFWGVEKPTGVTVAMNGGSDNYGTYGIENLQQSPAAIPVYGSCGEDNFTTTGTSAKPSGYDTTDADHQNKPAGLDENATYQLYAATVTLQIPVARLEVSGITHVGHPYDDPDSEEKDENACRYATLTIGGVYLDNLKATGNDIRGNYQFNASGSGTGSEAILKEAIPATFTPTGGTEITDYNDFLRQGGVWPANDVAPTATNAYAFNFYGPTATEIEKATTDEAKQALNPKFKIYFASATAAPNADPVNSPRYAMITNYKDKSGNSIVLQNGRIYKITDVALRDANIIGDEGGNTLIGVEVTVTEAAWTVVDIDADWAE